MMKRILSIIVIVVGVVAGAQSVLAQATNKGEISGTVTDETGAVIPGSTIEARNLETGLTRKTVTNDRGYYVLTLVDPGRYELRASMPGFKTQIRPEVIVETQSKVVVDFTLEPGEITEQITVEAREEVLRPTDTTVSGVISEIKMREMPLNNKAMAELTRLEAGATPPEITTAETSPNTDTGGFIHGLRQFFVHVTLDGGHYNDPVWSGGTMTTTEGSGISHDAVKEFTVVKGNPLPGQAGSGGYSINITTRSGGSEYHGDLFEYVRNDIFDARNFFDPEDPPPFRRNQFGGSLGGPLPIRNEKDFFFVNYEGFRRRLIETIVPVVPTPRLLDAIPGGAEFGYLREIFTHTYPRPTPGTFGPDDLVAPATSTTNLGLDRDQFLVRTDHQMTENTQATFRYNFSDGESFPGVTFRTGVRPGNLGFNWRFQNMLVNVTTTLSSTKVNEFRFTYNRIRFAFFGEPTPPELVALGFAPTSDSPNGIPFIFPFGTGLTFVGALPFIPRFRSQNVFEWNDILSVTTGRHTLNLGGTIARYQVNWFNGDTIRPFTFFSGFGPPFDESTFGLTTGTFLFQNENLFIRPPTPLRGYRFTEFSAYVQDRFQVTPTLTLNYGILYSLQTPIDEVNDLMSNAYPVVNGSPVENGDINDANISQLALVGVDRFDFSKFDKNNFAPNLGIAWLPFGRRSKVVIKAAYGISYARPFLELIRLSRFNPPFAQSTTIVAQRFGTRATPETSVVPPNLNVFNPSNVNPYVQYWNLTIERELEPNTVLRISYIGNKGTKIWFTRRPNFDAGFTGPRPNPSFSVIDLTETKADSIYHGLRIEVNRRFIHGFAIQGTYVYAKSIDDISSAITTFQPGGIGSIPTNQFDLGENRGVSDFDITHSAVINYIYELPFGRGRRFGKEWPGWVKALVGDWTISGITSFYDGLPFDVLSGIDNNGDGVANDRARVLPGARADNALVPGRGANNRQYLDPSGVLSVTGDVPLGRNVFRGPGIVNFDVAFKKRIPLGERAHLDFSAEIFNIFNHTNFGNPVNTLNSPLFGTILSTSTNARQIQFGLKLAF